MFHIELTDKPIIGDIKTEAPIVYHNVAFWDVLHSGTKVIYNRLRLCDILIKADSTPVKTVHEED